MELPDGAITGLTFRRVDFADLLVGEKYFVKYRSPNQKVDQYVMIDSISDMYPLTVYYNVIVERDADDSPWNNVDYGSDATKQQVNGKYAGIEAHFYVHGPVSNGNNNNVNNNNGNNNNVNNNNGNNNNGNNNNGNLVQDEVNAAQQAILASIPRPLRPGQRLLLNVNSNGQLPAFRVVTRRRRQKRRKPKTRRRRRHA